MEAPYLARSRWLAALYICRMSLPCASGSAAPRRFPTPISTTSCRKPTRSSRGLESVDSIRDPRTYALQVAKSVFLQGLRRSKVVPIGSITDLAALEDADDAPGPEQHAHGQRELRRVEAAIGEMPPQVRKVFWLRRVEGLSQRETATRLGLAEHTVEKYSARGIKFLLRQFGRGGNVTIESSKTQDPTLVEFDLQNAPSRTRQRD